ncbi:MAG: lysophospholipid acyltransferase family protein [Candidatus Omnitrophota bacterium]
MVSYYLYRLGQKLALALPIRKAYALAVLFSDLHYFFAWHDRRVTLQNLRAIFPQKSNGEIRRIRKEIFRNFAKYLVDFFRFSEIDRAYIENNVRIENVRYIEEGLSRGKGVITLTAHMGNWELGGAALALSGYPFAAVALPHKDKKVNSFFNYQRQIKGVKVIPVGKAVRNCLEVLRQNSVLALLGDRNFNEKGIEVDFFGKPTLLPAGPAALSLKTDAALVPGFMLRNPDDSFTLRFEKPIEFKESGDRESDIRALVYSYKTVIENYILRYPGQWSMFRRFWIE